jgi:hypothetical protein
LKFDGEEVGAGNQISENKNYFSGKLDRPISEKKQKENRNRLGC